MGCVDIKFASMCPLNVRISDETLWHAARNNKFSTYPSLKYLQTVTALLHQWREAGKIAAAIGWRDHCERAY